MYVHNVALNSSACRPEFVSPILPNPRPSRLLRTGWFIRRHNQDLIFVNAHSVADARPIRLSTQTVVCSAKMLRNRNVTTQTRVYEWPSNTHVVLWAAGWRSSSWRLEPIRPSAGRRSCCYSRISALHGVCCGFLCAILCVLLPRFFAS